jgi:hypothetical protein
MGFLFKGFRISMHRIFKGEIRSDAIEYEFGDYENKEKKKHIIDMKARTSPVKRVLPSKRLAGKKRAR